MYCLRKVIQLKHEREIGKFLGGIKNMERIQMYCLLLIKKKIAVSEARKLGIQ